MSYQHTNILTNTFSADFIQILLIIESNFFLFLNKSWKKNFISRISVSYNRNKTCKSFIPNFKQSTIWGEKFLDYYVGKLGRMRVVQKENYILEFWLK